MNKKIIITGCFLLFMLVAITLASAIETNTHIKKKNSPLYSIRIKRAISEKIDRILENIKTRFLGERIFFHQFTWLKNNLDENPTPGGWSVNKIKQ